MRALWFLVKFVMLTVPLTWLWMEWGRGAYGRLMTATMAPLYELLELGLPPGGARERYINYIPFIALMFITPRLSISRRLFGTAAGFLAIFTFHVFFSVWVQLAYAPGAHSAPGRFAIFLPALLLSDSLPLILWAILCPKFLAGVVSEAFGKLGLVADKGQAAPSPAADSGGDPDGPG